MPTAPSPRTAARNRPGVEELELRRLPALTIIPTFAANITSDPQAATIEATINRTIAAFESFITDNVTVNITFQEGGGLGGSNGGYFYPENYSAYRAALVSHAATANDNTAIASLPNTTNDPVNNNSQINVRSPLARALGFTAPPPGAGDGTITLNTAICNLDRTSTQDSTKYDLQAVTAHEIDEILGFGSALNNLKNGAAAPTGLVQPDDLFRYDQTGARSFNTTLATQAYFSIDGRTTDLARFNQIQGGDFSDWFSPATIPPLNPNPQVQDAFNTPGATANMGVELTRLDILGYSLSPLNAPVVTAATNQNTTEGTSGAFDLGRFSDSNVAPWGVTVSWGDGSPNTTYFLNNDGALGAKPHTYAEEGNYKVTVQVTNFTSRTQSQSFQVSVTDPPVQATGGQSISPVEGASTGSVLLATFTDPGGAESTGNYSADINWGDGSSTQVGAGSITLNGSTFEVRGSHSYGEESTSANTATDPYVISISIHHDATAVQSVTSTATISDPAVVKASAVPVGAAEGAAFAGASLATFTDPGGAEPNPSDPTGTHYTVASIAWGDGSPLDTSTGAIGFAGSAGSTTDPFTVTGGHTYGEEGTYTITVMVSHEGVLTPLTTKATVSDPAVLATAVPVNALTGKPLTGVAVATFTDPGGAEPNPSDPTGTHYTVASIAWGDGSPLDTSTGAVGFAGSAGSTTDPFTVTGGHTYEAEGIYTITVVIDHEGVFTTVKDTATVKDNLGLLLLDPSGSPSLVVTGNGGVDVIGNHGTVAVNSTAPVAASVTGNGAVVAGDIDVTGGTITTGHGSFSSPVGREAPTPDPLGLSLPPAPSPTFAAVNDSGSAPLILSPGTYVGGIKISGQGSVTLLPGVYYMKGGGFSVTGQGSVTGNGVLIVNAPGRSTDTFSLTGKGNVTLTAPATLTAPYSAYAGVAVFQDPASSAPINVTGQGALTVTGRIYAPAATLNDTGNGGVFDSYSNPDATKPGAIIVFDARVAGNGGLTINLTGPAVAPVAGTQSAAATANAGTTGPVTYTDPTLLTVASDPGLNGKKKT